MTGRFNKWDTEASHRMVELYADYQSGLEENELISILMKRITEKLAMEIISSQLGTFGQNGDLESCETCRKLFNTLLGKETGSICGSDWIRASDHRRGRPDRSVLAIGF